jgi:hypothetical protein
VKDVEGRDRDIAPKDLENFKEEGVLERVMPHT